jgi:hypothetical protein
MDALGHSSDLSLGDEEAGVHRGLGQGGQKDLERDQGLGCAGQPGPGAVGRGPLRARSVLRAPKRMTTLGISTGEPKCGPFLLDSP